MSKLTYSLFAFAIAICGMNGASACDACNNGANASQWATGCCEHEPMWSDHVWDGYCNEKNAPKQHRCGGKRCRTQSCSSNHGVPGAGRWRPRGGCSLGGLRGFAPGSCEAPIFMDEGVAAPPAPAMHGAGCMCPACQAASNPVHHGPDCNCPQCQAAAPASVAPAESELAPAPAPTEAILAPVPTHEEELQFEASEPAEVAQPAKTAPLEAEVQPQLKQQPFNLETPPADEVPAEK